MNRDRRLDRTSLLIVAGFSLLLVGSACGQPEVGPEEEHAWLLEDALTPRMSGQWTLVGCEEAEILISTFLNEYTDGFICTWRGHYGDGEPQKRTEWFDGTGKRLSSASGDVDESAE